MEGTREKGKGDASKFADDVKERVPDVDAWTGVEKRRMRKEGKNEAFDKKNFGSETIGRDDDHAAPLTCLLRIC